MTNLHILSDIHNEFTILENHKAPEGTDIVILDGDTHPGVAGIMWAAETFHDLPVLYLPGNHEYYGKRVISSHFLKMQEKAALLNSVLGSDVRVCDRHVHVIKNIRFICATLWTDYNLLGTQEVSMRNAEYGTGKFGEFGMNDYKEIYVRINKAVIPQYLLKQHNISVLFIKDQLEQPFDGKTVVITHHAPSAKSVEKSEKDIYLLPCYASHLDYLMEAENSPDIWIHGHLHSPQDYVCGKTRVIANPRGYVRKSTSGYDVIENPLFNSQFILSL